MSSSEFPFDWSRVRSQEAALGFLRRALSSGRLPHALLLWGPRGVGKRTAAKILAAAALCPERRAGADSPCGRCRSCRELAAGVNPDLIEPLVHEKRGSKEIARELTDQDREITLTKTIAHLVGKAALRASRAERRAILLPRAERMNEVCQNALLKALEEPVGERLWILTAEDPSRLATTVRSRLTPVRFGRLPTEVVAELLAARRRLAAGDAARLAPAAEGSITRAEELASEEWAEEARFLEEAVLPRIGRGPGAGPGLARALIERAAALARKASGDRSNAGARSDRPDRAEGDRGVDARSPKSSGDAPADDEADAGEESHGPGAKLERPRQAALALLESLARLFRERLVRSLGAETRSASAIPGSAEGERRTSPAAPAGGEGLPPERWQRAIEVALASARAIGQNIRVELVLSAAAAELARGPT